MGNQSYCLKGTVSVWSDKKLLPIESGDNYPTLWMYLMMLIYTLKTFWNGIFYYINFMIKTKEKNICYTQLNGVRNNFFSQKCGLWIWCLKSVNPLIFWPIWWLKLCSVICVYATTPLSSYIESLLLNIQYTWNYIYTVITHNGKVFIDMKYRNTHTINSI